MDYSCVHKSTAQTVVASCYIFHLKLKVKPTSVNTSDIKSFYTYIHNK